MLSKLKKKLKQLSAGVREFIQEIQDTAHGGEDYGTPSFDVTPEPEVRP